MKLKGIIVPIGTPVDSEERTDEKGLRKLTRHLVDNGIHGILANGSMGGFAHLDDKEQVRALAIILDEVAGRIPVIAHVGENGTRRIVNKAREFERLQPNYLAFLPPFYFLMTQKELKNFYQAVVNEVQTPAFLYNNPVTTKLDLELETILELSEHPNIVGIKDSKQDLDKWLRMARHFRDQDFSVFAGTEFLVSAALVLGCDGVIAGLHNICPQIAVRLYQAARRGDTASADELQQQLIQLFSIFDGDIWGSFEVALQHLGICEKVTISPFASITDAEARKRIIGILDKYLTFAASSQDSKGEAF